MKRLLSGLLSAVMAVSLMPAVLAEETTGGTNEEPVVIEEAVPVITVQPVGGKACVGDVKQLTVEAENAAAYRWEYSTDGKNWKKVVNTIPGYNKATMKLTIFEECYARLYRCQITGENGQAVVSNPVHFDKDSEEMKIVWQPVGKETTLGAVEELTVLAANAVSYRWEYSSNNGRTWSKVENTIPGYNKATLKLTMTEVCFGRIYRCKVTGQDGQTEVTEPARFTAQSGSAKITCQPVGGETSIGEVEILTTDAENAAAYRWEYSTDGGEKWYKVANTISGYNKATLKLTITEESFACLYRCRVTGLDGTAEVTESVQFTQKN